MKNIKVRVWDIDGGKMSAGFDIESAITREIDIEFPACDESLPWEDFMFFRKEYSDLMLYTGLKDKKGKDVYEGDILDFDANEWGAEGFKSAVEWDKKNAAWSFGGGLASDVFQWRKVVGNIYESPGIKIEL